jgi:DNA-binding NarL/FixJ family response regulator
VLHGCPCRDKRGLVSKKRPRIQRPRRADLALISKNQPQYWERRLFKNSYSYKGKRLEVQNWSVKIQYRAERKTFGLQATNRRRAAHEACALYRSILKAECLNDVPSSWVKRSEMRAVLGPSSEPGDSKSSPQYWEQRLINREYAMKPQSGALSFAVRIDYEGSSCYFPLATTDRNKSAMRARRVFQFIQRSGWDAAFQRFSREVTVGFRWNDTPLAWTYTTLHTQVRPQGYRTRPIDQSNRIPVAVAEADSGIREALVWCLNRMEHFRCARVFASAAEALAGLDPELFRLILVSQNLPDKPGNVCLGELRGAAPMVACLLYSTYEDSEELFRSTPGGAGIYLLKRTSATEFLEPIASALMETNPTAQVMLNGVWQYFKNALSSPPTSGSGHELANLTRREEEVLALLGKGQPDKEIADHLRISAHTVHGHVRKIFEKLGVHNRTEAVVRYLQK